jgi:hypothetical protein
MVRLSAPAGCVILGLVPFLALAQNCKPDVSMLDKISKQQVDMWRQNVWSTSLASSLVNTSESAVTVAVGRYGSVNAVSLIIKKKEESATNAAFEAAYRGAKGQPFVFGLKSGGPLSLVVTEVSNAADVEQGLFGAKGVTTVVLAAVLSDEEMGDMRTALSSQPVDAVRLLLAGGVQLDKEVSENDGRRLMAKFVCFFQSLDQRGVRLSSGGAVRPPGEPLTKIVIDEHSPPGDVVKEIYAAGNDGRYSEVESLLSKAALDLNRTPAGAAVGGVKGIWDRETRNGTLVGATVIRETARGEGADVCIRFTFKDGKSIQVARPLVREAGTWKISTWSGPSTCSDADPAKRP